ncbi:MAG TPA: hypothetical protein VGG90_08755 [Candidatus Dormibacteraeota bacterium]|jgi:hypothetical protein
MRKRFVVIGTAVTAIALWAGQAAASANVVWCMSDPPIQVVTQGGHNLTVNNMIYIPPVDRHVMDLVTDDAVATADGRGGTYITVHVHLPAAISHAHVVSSDNRYQVSAAADGTGGVTVTLLLDVPTS